MLLEMVLAQRRKMNDRNEFKLAKRTRGLVESILDKWSKIDKKIQDPTNNYEDSRKFTNIYGRALQVTVGKKRF